MVKHIVLEAGDVLLEYFRKSGSKVEHKEGAGIVTAADKDSEKLLIQGLKREFPDSDILAEESGTQRGKGVMKWIIDPLDGTSNFAHGLPWFCISVGLEMNGEIVLGCIYNPVIGELFYAEKGKGAYLNDEPISISQEKDLKNCLFATGFYYFTGDELNKQLIRIKRVKEKSLGVRRLGSAALDLAYTAAGYFDGFWEIGLMPWDVAAGSILVKEAGGMVTDLTSGPDYIYNRNVIASNEHIYNKLLWLL